MGGGLALLVAASAFAGATTSFTAPFAPGFGDFENEAACQKGIYDTSRTAGRVEVYADACNGGSVDTLAWLGSLPFRTNEGETLEQWTVPVTATYSVAGTTACMGLGSEARVTVSLTKWRLIQNRLVQQESGVLRQWSCVPNAGDVAFSHAGSGTVDLTFDPGLTYRLLLEAKAHALAVTPGSATADVCTDASNQCGGSPSGQELILQGIVMANAPPKARVDSGPSYWFAIAYLFKPRVNGTGCDADGPLASLRLEVHSATDHARRDFPATDLAACISGSLEYNVTAPLTYTAWANATDTEGAAGSDQGRIEMQVLPFGLGQSVSGFPDLSGIPPSELGQFVTIDTRVGAAGNVRAYRVTTDGRLIMSTWSGVMPEPGDHLVKVEYDRVLQVAWVKIGSTDVWRGGVVPSDANANAWWKIRAVADVNAPPTPDDGGQPRTFPELRSYPDEPMPESGST